jgi:transposase
MSKVGDDEIGAGVVDAASNARLLVRQRTQLINAVRGRLAELGLVAAQGRNGLKALIAMVVDMRAALRALVAHLQAPCEQIATLEGRIHGKHRSNQAGGSRRSRAVA